MAPVPFPRPFTLGFGSLLILALPASAAGGGEQVVHVAGEDHPLTELPAAVDERMRAAVERWAPWAEELDYRMDIDPTGRVLLLTGDGTKGKKAKKMVPLVAATTAVFDELLPEPEVRADAGEQVEQPTWGVGIPVPGQDPIVLICAASEHHYSRMLEHLTELYPYLKQWAAGAHGGPAFVDFATQTSGWLDAPPDMEIDLVWRTENELVDALALLLVQRRFGNQPDWMRQGIAWYHEMQVHGDIYSFPGRDSFASVGEHAGWKNELKRAFKKRKKQPLELDEFVTLSRGTWEQAKAELAWGFVEFLAEYKRDSFPAMLEGLRISHKRNSRIDHEDGTWELIPGYVVPPETQREILLEEGGDALFEEASEYFVSWKPYKPGR